MPRRANRPTGTVLLEVQRRKNRFVDRVILRFIEILLNGPSPPAPGGAVRVHDKPRHGRRANSAPTSKVLEIRKSGLFRRCYLSLPLRFRHTVIAFTVPKKFVSYRETFREVMHLAPSRPRS